MVLIDKTIKETLFEALESFGYDIQKDITIEEMAELTKELIKEKRHDDNLDEVIDEIADVYIMICQMIIMYGEKQVEKRIITKIKRLYARIELVNDKDSKDGKLGEGFY